MANEAKTSYTLADYHALEKAIGEGAKVVKYNDKWVEYRSLDEMFKQLRFIAKQLGLNKKSCGKKGLFGGSRISAKHSKGLD